MRKTLTTKIVAVLSVVAFVFALGGCGTDLKPDAATVKAGVAEAIKSQFGTGEESQKMIAMFDCIIDEAYDDLSLSTLLEFAQGKDLTDLQVDSEERIVLERVSKKCLGELTGNSGDS